MLTNAFISLQLLRSVVYVLEKFIVPDSKRDINSLLIVNTLNLLFPSWEICRHEKTNQRFAGLVTSLEYEYNYSYATCTLFFTGLVECGQI